MAFAIRRVTREEAMDIAFKHGGFIAGGYAVYKAKITVTYKDIDMWFPNEMALYNAAVELTQLAKTKKSGSMSVRIVPSGLQCGKVSYNCGNFGTPQEILEDFDFSLVRWYMDDAAKPPKNIHVDHMYAPINGFTQFINPNLNESQIRSCWERLNKYLNRATNAHAPEVVASIQEFFNLYLMEHGKDLARILIGGSGIKKAPSGGVSPTIYSQVLDNLRHITVYRSMPANLVLSTPVQTPQAVSLAATQASCTHPDIQWWDSGFGGGEKFQYCTKCGLKVDHNDDSFEEDDDDIVF